MKRIVLTGPRNCGKSSTLRIIQGEVQNIYQQKILDCRIADQGDSFSAAIDIDGRLVVIDTAEHPAPPGAACQVWITEETTGQAGNGLAVPEKDLIIVTKSLRESSQAQMLANIKDCDAILTHLESLLAW